MQELNLKSTVIRKKKITVFNAPIYKTFENILKQNFNVNAPNIKWCSDLTYIKLANGNFVYACTIIDLYDRSIIGFDVKI